MVYKRRYEYWHKVLFVSKEYAKNNKDVKAGVCITLSYPRNGGVRIINIEKKKTYKSAYTVKYLGRLLIDMDDDLKFKRLKEMMNDVNVGVDE